MNKDSLTLESIKDTKQREYFIHLKEVSEKQNKEILLNKKSLQILQLNYHQDLPELLNKLPVFFKDDQFSSIRIIVKKQESQSGNLAIKAGLGTNCEAFAYLDDQIEDQLGKPGILYITDTTKIHSIKFNSGNQFPRTILGISLGSGIDKLGMIWFACEKQKSFTKFESDSMIALVDACTLVIKNCIEWNQNLLNLTLRNEILDLVPFPILIVSSDDIIYSNNSANLSFVKQFENISEKEEFIRRIWNRKTESEYTFDYFDHEYEIRITDSVLLLQKPVRTVILIDETLFQKQRDYISLVVDSLEQGLRSPLNLILGSTKMLTLVGEINSHQKEYIDNIQHKTEETLDIVEELLNLERITKINGLKVQQVNLKNLVNTSSALTNHFARQKRISIIDNTSNEDAYLNVDKALFTQALANILEFAIEKTGMDGEIVFCGEKMMKIWQLTIKDNSNGLSPLEVERLNSLDNLHEIPNNLLLIRRIIGFHGGTFKILSELGKGNTYSIEIPAG